MTAHRGDIWLVDFGPPVGTEQAGTRPAVVLSVDRLNRSGAALVIVVPCTTRQRGLSSHVEIDTGGSGLDEVTYAKCEDVKSVSTKRLVRHLGEADPAAMFRIQRGVGFLLGIA